MESFAAVVRTLLHRIRAIQDRHDPGPRPAAVNDRAVGRIYRVRPTTWGVAAPETPRPARPAPASPAAARTPGEEAGRGRARRGLELTVYGLPVPRGLPST